MSNQKNVPIAPNMGNQRHVSIVPNMVREKRQLASNPPETNIGVDGRSDTPTLSSKPIAADKSRRPKACTNCRKSKIKCIKDTNDQTCKRCKAQGLQCVYEYKVASYKYADRNSLIEETPINSQINNQVHTKAKSAKNSTILPLINIGNNQHENIPIPHVNHLLHPLPKIGQAATVSNTDSIPLGAQQHQIQASSASLLSKAGTDSLNVINNNQLQSIPRLLNPVNDSRSNTISAQNYQEDNQASKSIIMTNELNKWEKSVENRFDDLGSTLATVLSLLQEQKSKNEQVDTVSNPNQNRSIDTTNSPTNHKRQKFEIQEKEVPMKPSLSRASSNSNYSVTSLDALEDFDLSDPVTTLNKILSREDARELFSFFNTNISPQLFGFDISKYSIDDIWDTCPLLIATIGCISSIHHPFLSNVSPYLEKIIYEISKDILFNIPKTESEAFNTIMALCFCGFWFKNNQMFTGLAIQLARTMNLISPHNIKGKKGAKSIIPRKDRLKLWYLLYILDGQQSLVFNRQSMFDSHDETFKNGKQLLIAAENDSLDDDDDDDDSVDMQKVDSVSFNTSYADIRLISQVEYHQAVNAVFEGGAWDLLTPSSFGIPFKTNLELDKWMVQWTVLLSPFNNHPIWSSKSTLIYYNFAKMHINSSAVRKFHVKGFDLPKFDELEDDFYHASSSSDISEKYIEELHTHDVNHYDNEDDDTDDTDDIDDSLDMAKELSPIQSRKVSAELALSAAETVLNIVLGDADILSVLKYVPIHIHIMLYYSALLILKPHACLDGNGNFFDKYENDEERFEASLNAMKLVKRLRHSIIVNSPTDKEFSRKIVDSLTGILHDKVVQIKAELGRSVTDMNAPQLIKQRICNEFNIGIAEDIYEDIDGLTTAQIAHVKNTIREYEKLQDAIRRHESSINSFLSHLYMSLARIQEICECRYGDNICLIVKGMQDVIKERSNNFSNRINRVLTKLLEYTKNIKKVIKERRNFELDLCKLKQESNKLKSKERLQDKEFRKTFENERKMCEIRAKYDSINNILKAELPVYLIYSNKIAEKLSTLIFYYVHDMYKSIYDSFVVAKDYFPNISLDNIYFENITCEIKEIHKTIQEKIESLKLFNTIISVYNYVPVTIDGNGYKVGKVLYDFHAEGPGELTISKGDSIQVLEENPSGWWKGKLINNGLIGYFPYNYLAYEK